MTQQTKTRTGLTDEERARLDGARHWWAENEREALSRSIWRHHSGTRSAFLEGYRERKSR